MQQAIKSIGKVNEAAALARTVAGSYYVHSIASSFNITEST